VKGGVTELVIAFQLVVVFTGDGTMPSVEFVVSVFVSSYEHGGIHDTASIFL
tara:strand:- start:592 stop:747 length:156 start_codon:yes stop_codon:yes gene_type:complete